MADLSFGPIIKPTYTDMVIDTKKGRFWHPQRKKETIVDFFSECLCQLKTTSIDLLQLALSFFFYI